MEQAAKVAEQVQRGIKLEQQQLSELHAQALRQAQLNELTPEQTTAVAHLLSRQQEQSSRRAIWWNFAIGFVFYVLGVATPALLSSDVLRQWLQEWLHLG
jgi:hypothetical protein